MFVNVGQEANNKQSPRREALRAVSGPRPPERTIVPPTETVSRVHSHRLRRRPTAALDPAPSDGFAPLSEG